MRRSFDGLFGLVQAMIHEDPFSGSLFLFRSRRGDFIKVLWWDLDGFAIFAKRLEVGTFQFPDVTFVDGQYEPVEIERAELLMLLEGIDTDSVKRSKRYRHKVRDRVVMSTPKVHRQEVRKDKSTAPRHFQKNPDNT
jgi:transposase